jgi:hypothetical protein
VSDPGFDLNVSAASGGVPARCPLHESDLADAGDLIVRPYPEVSS